MSNKDDKMSNEYTMAKMAAWEVVKQYHRNRGVVLRFISAWTIGILATLAWSIYLAFATGWGITHWMFWIIIQPGAFAIGIGTGWIARIIWKDE